MGARVCVVGTASALALTMALPSTGTAQGTGPGTWQFESGGGVAIPLNSELSDFVKTGADFDVLIGYQVHERVGLNVYGGLSLLNGKDDTIGLTTAGEFPGQDLWRYGGGLEVSLTRPGSAFMALLGAGLGGVTVRTEEFILGANPPVPVNSTSSTSFSALTALKFLYRVNPNFGVGAGAEWVLAFSADTIDPTRQGETMSYLPVKIFLRWMQ
jgi:hypothetical protein